MVKFFSYVNVILDFSGKSFTKNGIIYKITAFTYDRKDKIALSPMLFSRVNVLLSKFEKDKMRNNKIFK